MKRAKRKSVNLVTFSDGKLAEVTALDIPATQPLAVIKGDFAEICRQLEQWRDASTDTPVWLDIEITTQDYLADMQRKIQPVTEDLPVEVLLVRRSREQREKILAGELRETLSELRVEEVFERRLAQEEIDEMQTARLQALFSEARQALNDEEENA